ncbi:NAD(P)/FAD-dependent oxidoreductase [Roseovarius sp. MMSF_3281]|uniref:NAD(P)/FAD-dependent oxidoreductase n=1 Tax=Roseovarius sp. MMSF_3281 TaxID=3046694 RepID=UPI00273F387B|nr:NAD(P)/FAD-dependent oxidoreductase [Roseovarius sp. MMSF_3281]
MTRVLIVGAGPAGIRAAEVLVAAGLRPVVVDEGARAGGQIYRRPTDGFKRPPRTLYGSEAGKAVQLHETFDGFVCDGQVDYHPRCSVLGLQDGVAQVLGPDGVFAVPYDRLILAPGATDRLAPVPGWQMAGVFSLGAAQIALKSQGVALGRQIVLAGSGPLLTLVASQLISAGATVAAVLDTAPWGAQIRGGFDMALARPGVTLRGLRLRAGLGRRYRAGVTLTGIEGDGTSPAAVTWRDTRGRAHRTACDTVALGWHLRAETALADLAGAEFAWSDIWAQWLPRTDAAGRAQDGVYLAGDGMSILGADGAEIAGRLAARACLADLGHHVDVAAQNRDLGRKRRMGRFAKGIATAFPWPAEMVRALPEDAILCRCEGITAGDLRRTLTLSGPEVNRAKSLSRVGMGRCQGRYCQIAGAEVTAAQVGCGPATVGRLRAQPPVRPAPLGVIAAAADKPE